MKVGSKVGSNFGSVTDLVINYMDQRMELITSKLWVNRSNRFRGTKTLVDKLLFMMEFVVFMDDFIGKLSIEETILKLIK